MYPQHTHCSVTTFNFALVSPALNQMHVIWFDWTYSRSEFWDMELWVHIKGAILSPSELFPPSCVFGVAACVSDRPPYRHHFSTDCPTTSIGKTKRTQATIQIFVNKCENFHLMETCSTSWVDKLYFKQTHHPTKVRRRTKSAGLYRRRKKPQDWYEYWVYGPKQAFFIPQQHVSVKIWNLSWI